MITVLVSDISLFAFILVRYQYKNKNSVKYRPFFSNSAPNHTNLLQNDSTINLKHYQFSISSQISSFLCKLQISAEKTKLENSSPYREGLPTTTTGKSKRRVRSKPLTTSTPTIFLAFFACVA